VPVTQFGRDRPPFGTIVQPPNDRFDRAPVFLARTCPAQLGCGDRGFELSPLGVGEYLHGLSQVEPPEHPVFDRFAKCLNANRP
jgi:hypothetical protein